MRVNERLFLRLDGDPLYASETSVPAGTMLDYPVPAPLSDYVSSVIAYREVIPADQEVIERVLPDGAVRLIFDLGDAPADGAGAGRSAIVATGASAAPALLRLRGRLEGVSVALRPGAASAMLGVPAAAIAGEAVALADLWRTDGREVIDRIAAAADNATRVAVLLASLQSRLPQEGEAVRQMATRAARLIGASGGQLPLRQAADAVGVGERRLQQIFRREVGLSPRTWIRLARMHSCLRELRLRPAPRWAEVAADAGFYDQPHLANEFKALCGLPPSQFLARSIAGSRTSGSSVSGSSKTGG